MSISAPFERRTGEMPPESGWQAETDQRQGDQGQRGQAASPTGGRGGSGAARAHGDSSVELSPLIGSWDADLEAVAYGRAMDSDVTELVERLWAHEQIRQLAAHYAVAIDSRDLDALVALFVDDVRVGRDTYGRDALKASFDSSLRAIGVSMLNVGTHAIDLVDADHATGSVYCHGQIQDGDRWIHQSILYRDTYERRDGTWYFVRRIHELWYGLEVDTQPARPGARGLAAAPRRARDGARVVADVEEFLGRRSRERSGDLMPCHD